MNRNNQQGFTLIELIMVIVILGILAATALPKFCDLSSSARVSTMRGLQGAINSASATAASAYLVAAASSTTTVTSVSLNGAANGVTVNTSGFPDATASGIGAAIQLDNNAFTPTYAANSAVNTTNGTATFQLTARASATCQVSYSPLTGSATLTLTGC